MLAQGADVLVLGCTHFAFLRSQIETAVGDSARIIDTGPAVARELERRLRAAGLLEPSIRAGSERFWTSAEPAQVRDVLERLWGVGQLAAMPPRPAAAKAAG